MGGVWTYNLMVYTLLQIEKNKTKPRNYARTTLYSKYRQIQKQGLMLSHSLTFWRQAMLLFCWYYETGQGIE